MTKNEFMSKLRESLSGSAEHEVEDRLNFYGEMIDDLMEEGFSEEQSVLRIASRLDSELASDFCFEAQVSPEDEGMREIPNENKTKGSLSGWAIMLIVLGSPIWASLAIAVFAVTVSLYAVLWSVVIAAWATFVSFAVCAVAFVLVAPVLVTVGAGLPGLMLIGAGMVCAGLSIFVFFGCRAMMKGALYISKLPFKGFGKAFVKGEGK